MGEEHVSVRINSAYDSADGAGRRLDSRLANIIGHKRLDQFNSKIGGHHGLLCLLDVHKEMHTSGLGDCFRGGIMANSVQVRRSQFGANRLRRSQSKSLWDFVRESVEDDRILQLLIGSAILSIVLGVTTPDYRDGTVDISTGWVEGAAIIVSILIVVTINSFNNYKKQAQFLDVMAQEDRTRLPLLVWRYDHDGESYTLRSREIPSEEVVVGDVVRISSGMELNFDAILFDGQHIICDEGNMTGENDEVVKHMERDPFLISGSSILDGSSEGVGVVCAVGERSFAGEIAMTVEGTEKKNSPLQDQLEEMAERIGKYGFVAAILTFVALFLKELYGVISYGSPFFAMKFFENLTTAIAIVVVAVPEGLPLSVTISLAYSMRRMLQDGNLVRHLAACETMGGATILCTDKTGTLTAPNMTLARVFFEGNSHDRDNDSEGGIEEFITTTSSKVASLLVNCVVANFADTETRRARNKTGDVLMQLCSSIRVSTPGKDVSKEELLKEVDHMLSLMRDENRYVCFPFNSFEKKCTSIIRLGEEAGLREFVSGAPEIVLSQCVAVVMKDGRLDPLTAERRKYYENVIRVYNGNGFRTLCCAYGDENSAPAVSMPAMPLHTGLNLLAIVALEEAIRPEVPGSLEACARAGLRVIMITGDAPLTAVNTANRCGLLINCVNMETSADHLMATGVVMDGQVFRSLSDTELLDKHIPNLCVLARATPLDKKRVLQLLKRYDPQSVVAVTGDGINDAPALKMSDVGFAMHSGSDVAKRASDIVLLNDNFSGMVKATMWGRNVKDNIRKFLQFQLTVNGVACIVAFLGALMSEQNLSPLKPVQLLWINLIMDTMAALALATELPSEEVLLSRPPEPRNAPVILPGMWFHVVTQGTFQVVLQLYLLRVGHKFFPLSEEGSKGGPYIERFGPKHLCIVFNVFVLMQVMNFFNARLLGRVERFFGRCTDSVGLFFIVAIILFVQVGIVQFGGRFMSTVPLTVEEWFVCIVCASGSVVVGALSRICWWGKNAECGQLASPKWFRRFFILGRFKNGQKISE